MIFLEKTTLHLRLLLIVGLRDGKRIGGSKGEYGYKGKGSSFHLITDDNGKPFFSTVTATNDN